MAKRVPRPTSRRATAHHVIETLRNRRGSPIEAQLLCTKRACCPDPSLTRDSGAIAAVMAMPLSTRCGRALDFPNFEIRAWSDNDYQSAAAVITAAYRGHVDARLMTSIGR